ncbi:class I SAM-dependent methyltransferase [Pseudoalteromonas lipolytica]|uniref:class I SAM-dependent methyltransferase n=1 Tax=Pseudoalteromonas lipolytica TaxID=570156 RepID=UPI00044E5C75|nr:class I SAM-dependent methyltransferase [Pseudoalteromonas lipolytica]EWH07008.1 methyltransferase type 12 [Pseudoalteromonas lipolytica SCSIO 04301]|tara:strand:+ start:13208 stop:13978 length:771 start_codon:yes stop_codon:yes gene_type:complete
MDYIKINKEAWNNKTPLHIASKFYNLPAFIEGQTSLNPIELSLLGDVKGKSLLHLQCHFGQDTLSWARLGANVTGVDLSSTAIEQANKLKDSLALNAHFIESDIYQFGQFNDTQYDIVFTSYGVLSWLPNLDNWAQVIADALKAGGEFYLIEFHPFQGLFDGYSYFPKSTPDIEEEGTYTENCDGTKSKTVSWSHSISEVISSLLKAGLSIEACDEYPFSPYDCFDGLEYIPHAGYQLLHNGQQVPLVFSIKARKR